MSQKILEKVLQKKIIAIIRGVSSQNIIKTVQALLDGGIECVEVTFNPSNEEKSKDTLISIQKINEQFKGRVIVGAGTVLTEKQVEDAVNAGAEYIISPNTNEQVIKKTKQLGKISMPGALTPTEAQYAYEIGADIVKMFPAGVLGLDYIKAVKSSMNHLVVAAVGGVDENNIKEFIHGGVNCFGIGSNLVNVKLVEQGRYDLITQKAKKFVEAVCDTL